MTDKQEKMAQVAMRVGLGLVTGGVSEAVIYVKNNSKKENDGPKEGKIYGKKKLFNKSPKRNLK